MEKITIEELIRIAGKAYVPTAHDGYAVYDKQEDRVIATWDKPKKDDERYVLLYTIPKDILNSLKIDFIDPEDKDELLRFKNSSLPNEAMYIILKAGFEPVKDKIIEAIVQGEKENIRNSKKEMLDCLKNYVLIDEDAVSSGR